MSRSDRSRPTIQSVSAAPFGAGAHTHPSSPCPSPSFTPATGSGAALAQRREDVVDLLERGIGSAPLPT
jgi:hypothetical protein